MPGGAGTPGGYDGGGGRTGGGNGGGGYQDRIQQIAAAQARAASRAAEQQAAARRDMQETIAKAEKAEAIRVAEADRNKKLEAMQGRMIYRKPISLPPKRKPTIFETSDTGPFKRDDSDYQDRIRQAKSKIEFDPNLSLEEKADRNKILDDFVYKGTFAAEPKKNLFDIIKGGATGIGKAYLSTLLPKPIQTALTGRKIAETIRPGITEDLLNRINLTPTKDRIIKQSIATGGQGEGAQQVVSGGGDVVTQKIKEFTGEKETQQTDSKRSQLLLLLKQLQQYDSQNRLNDRGKQYLARLMSFMNQPLPGRNRDI